MADYDWPSELPRAPLQGSLSVAHQDNVVRSPADIGEGQVRRRASSSSRIMSFTMIMTREELKRLEVFYGVVGQHYRFNFVDPLEEGTKEFRFNEPYTVTHMQADVYNVGLTLIRKAE